MSQERRYVLSAVANWLAFAATLLVAFFLSPYLIRKLGDSGYGVWVFVESILAYFTLFDLGIAACVVRFVARFHTSKDQLELNRLVSSCLVLFLVLGMSALLIGVAVTPWIMPALDKSGLAQGEILAFTFLMLGNLAVTLPMSVFPAMLDGLERFAWKSIVHIVILALRTAAMIALMENQPSLLGLGIILTVCNLAELAAFAIMTRLFLPGLQFSFKLVNRATLKLVKGYSADAFVAMIAGRISVQSGAIVIGIFLSAPEITWFAIALRLVDLAKAMMRSATTTLTPAISSLETSGNVDAIRKVLLKGTRWVLYLILPVHAGLLLFGVPFLRIWMGSEEYVTHCYPALVILSTTLSLAVAQSIAARILYGIGRLRLYSRLSLLESVLNLSISLILVQRLGIEGVAWGTTIPNVCFCLFVIGYVCRYLGVSWREYVRVSWLRPLTATVPAVVIWLSHSTPAGWMELAIALASGLVPYAAVVSLFEGSQIRDKIWSLGRGIRIRSRKATQTLAHHPRKW